MNKMRLVGLPSSGVSGSGGSRGSVLLRGRGRRLELVSALTSGLSRRQVHRRRIWPWDMGESTLPDLSGIPPETSREGIRFSRVPR
jgi:hypothetical protein